MSVDKPQVVNQKLTRPIDIPEWPKSFDIVAEEGLSFNVLQSIGKYLGQRTTMAESCSREFGNVPL